MALTREDMSAGLSGQLEVFENRMKQRQAELKSLYTGLYQNSWMYAELIGEMEKYYSERDDRLKRSDAYRESDPSWYRKNDMLGMMMYVDNFAGDLRGVRKKLSYIEEAGVNVIHLMPFLDIEKGRNDGGYAVRDFRKVRKDLGDMADLSDLTTACHKRDICICADFALNHTSDKHEWAIKAMEGDSEYADRYFIYDTDEIPNRYDETVPQVFPVTAPGNFTRVDDKYVLTTFHPYQWDLNYKNSRVFNEMVYNFLYLANRGIDIFRLDAIPYIWKELGTNCRNLPEVHIIVRMLRLITEIVCPGVLLLGEVVMEPEKVVPYFGTVEKPECHVLNNVTTMATIWHTVATRDTRLLRNQFDIVTALPKEYVFLNYLRCHDDIGWGLDYAFLADCEMEENAHKKYLNNYFIGVEGYSNSRGELYNEDPETGDARICGTTASLCGIEKASMDGDKEAMAQAINLDIMLHACMLMLSGIPMLYSGDEIGQINDYTYLTNPEKKEDARYLHRGKFRWDLERKRINHRSKEYRIFKRLRELERIRANHRAFLPEAEVLTVNTFEKSVLVVGRYLDGEKIYGVFNFSEHEKTIWPDEDEGFVDLVSGDMIPVKELTLPGYTFFILCKDEYGK